MSTLAARMSAWLPGGAMARPLGPAVVSGGYRLLAADVRLLAALYVGARLIVVTAIALAYLANPARLELGLEDIFCNWDCDWYAEIARNGYVTPDHADKHGVANWAFFPVMPAAMAWVAGATGLSVAWAGIAVATVAGAIGLFGFFLMMRDLVGLRAARFAAAIYAFWPFAVHSMLPMTEALFVPLTVWLFLTALRGNWLAAGATAAVLSATRTVGVLAFLPLMVLAARQYGLWRLATLRPGTERAVLALGLTGLGLALYMLYLAGLTGDALAFSHNQAAWNRFFKLPWMMLLDELNPAYSSPAWLMANVANAATGIGALLLLSVLWKRGMVAEAVFAGTAMMVALTSASANSLPRYAGGLVPLVIAVALVGDRPLWRWPVLAGCLAAEAILAYAWGLEQFYVM